MRINETDALIKLIQDLKIPVEYGQLERGYNRAIRDVLVVVKDTAYSDYNECEDENSWKLLT